MLISDGYGLLSCLRRGIFNSYSVDREGWLLESQKPASKNVTVWQKCLLKIVVFIMIVFCNPKVKCSFQRIKINALS